MKRDMELIRKMVLRIEDDPSSRAPKFEMEEYTDEQIGYHAYLLVDAGLAEGIDRTSRGSPGPYYLLTHLTSAGHDFAESAKNQFVWDEVKEDLRKKGIVSTTMEVFKKILDKKIRDHLGVS